MSAPLQITPADILPPDVYAAQRSQRRARIIALKKNRRINVGPFATFYFENYDTMFQQVHEMLHVEGGGGAQIADELAAYNPLIPNGRNLVATLMFEINDALQRAAILERLGHVEDTAFMDLGANENPDANGSKVRAAPTQDLERTSAQGRTASVHFLLFPFTQAQIHRLRTAEKPPVLALAHPRYEHTVRLTPEQRDALAADFAPAEDPA